MVNRTLIPGAMILLPQTYLHWNITDIKDLTCESLSIIRLLAEKPGDQQSLPSTTMHAH
jgi:hypothetical protein